MTDFLSHFLSEMKKEVKKVKKKQVLCIITATCSCGAKYTYPNRSRMIRRGGNIKVVEGWKKSYDALPREVIKTEIEIDACQKCFTEGEES